jgi:hypothetical protein
LSSTTSSPELALLDVDSFSLRDNAEGVLGGKSEQTISRRADETSSGEGRWELSLQVLLIADSRSKQQPESAPSCPECHWE